MKYVKRGISWLLVPVVTILVAIYAGMTFGKIPGAEWVGRNVVEPLVNWNDRVLMEEDEEL